jgi:hypothetical protein
MGLIQIQELQEATNVITDVGFIRLIWTISLENKIGI